MIKLLLSPAKAIPGTKTFRMSWATAGFSTTNAFSHVMILTMLVLFPILLSAQNTFGGVKNTIPEAEVKRQSQFLMAERERLLNHNDKALELYKKFTYDNPNNDAGWYGLARTYTSLKELPIALDAIGKAVILSPENQWYSVYQADLFEKVGRLSEAVMVYENLLKRFPETPEFYEQLAYLSLQNEDPKRALKALENGTGSTLRTMVAVLRVLKREDWLKSIAPVASINPLTMTRTANPRRRASKQLRPGAAPHKRAESVP